jgi:DNA-binding IclR family transcriptional regulator
MRKRRGFQPTVTSASKPLGHLESTIKISISYSKIGQENNMVRTRESRPAQVGVVMKVLKILEVIHSNPSGLQLKEIAKQTAVNKSTAYRFLAHLQGEGYLYRDDAGAYVIGPKLARMGSGTNFEESLRKMGRSVLQKLWTATSETVNLAILDGQQILYLDVIESSHTFRFASQNGARRPLYCTALGKAILAHLPEEDTKELLASCTFERQTPRTLTQPTKLKKDLVKTRMQGYALDNEEAVLGARCIAAPVFDATGKVIGGVSVSGPLTRMTEEKVPVIAALVKDAANSISRRLGYQREIGTGLDTRLHAK